MAISIKKGAQIIQATVGDRHATNTTKMQLEIKTLKIIISSAPFLSEGEKTSLESLLPILSLESLEKLTKSLTREGIRYFQKKAHVKS